MMWQKYEDVSERFGLSLYAKKSINIMYNGAPLELEQVKQFIYLGANFNEKEIPSRR